MSDFKRVDRPTNLISDNVQRVDQRETAFSRAARGDYGPAVQTSIVNTPLPRRYPLSFAQSEIIDQLARFEDNPVAASKAPIPDDHKILSEHIKQVGYFLQADAMGICLLPKSAVYSHDIKGNPITADYKYAIVILMRKEYRTIRASSGTDCIGDPVSFQSYQRGALVAETMANYIRKLGYPASAQHQSAKMARYQVVLPPLVLWAGLGEVSRTGIILNPRLGLGFKAAAVLTDMPLEPDKPIDFGLQGFCRQCKICADLCPSKAISAGDKAMYNGYETWKLNEQRCASFSILNKKGTICNRCVKVCPWSNPPTGYHNLVRRAVQHSSLAASIAIKASRLTGREKAHNEDKWWFDLA
jgi:reductive dehalogenase